MDVSEIPEDLMVIADRIVNDIEDEGCTSLDYRSLKVDIARALMAERESATLAERERCGKLVCEKAREQIDATEFGIQRDTIVSLSEAAVDAIIARP